MTITTKFNIGETVYDSGRKRSFEVGEIRVRVWETERAALPNHRLTLTEYRSVNFSSTGVPTSSSPWVAERYLEAAK